MDEYKCQEVSRTNILGYFDLNSYPHERKLHAFLLSQGGLHQPFSCMVECVPNDIHETTSEGITDYGRRSTIKRNTLQ